MEHDVRATVLLQDLDVIEARIQRWEVIGPGRRLWFGAFYVLLAALYQKKGIGLAHPVIAFTITLIILSLVGPWFIRRRLSRKHQSLLDQYGQIAAFAEKQETQREVSGEAEPACPHSDCDSGERRRMSPHSGGLRHNLPVDSRALMCLSAEQSSTSPTDTIGSSSRRPAHFAGSFTRLPSFAFCGCRRPSGNDAARPEGRCGDSDRCPALPRGGRAGQSHHGYHLTS